MLPQPTRNVGQNILLFASDVKQKLFLNDYWKLGGWGGGGEGRQITENFNRGDKSIKTLFPSWWYPIFSLPAIDTVER